MKTFILVLVTAMLFLSCSKDSGNQDSPNAKTETTASLTDFQVDYELDGKLDSSVDRPTKLIAYRIRALDTSKVFLGRDLYTLFDDNYKSLVDGKEKLKVILKSAENCNQRVDAAKELAKISLFGAVLTDLRSTAVYFGNRDFESVGHGWSPPSTADYPNPVYINYNACK